MRIRMLVILLVGGFVVMAAWLVHTPRSAQADEIPEKYRETLSKGLEYLVKKQHKDGHWEGDDGEHPVAMTGLVGLAVLLEGADYNGDGRRRIRNVDRKYGANVQRAVDWLIERSRAERDGLIFSEHASETARYMEGHGLATLFLAGADQQERDDKRGEKLHNIITRAVKYIVKAQSSQGGWYHTSKVEGHDFDVVSATVIQIQALQAAHNAGIAVPAEVIHDAQTYLKQAIDKHETAKVQSAARSTETAAALACRFNIVGDFVVEMTTSSQKWHKYCEAEIAKGAAVKFDRDELRHFYYAQFLLAFSPHPMHRILPGFSPVGCSAVLSLTHAVTTVALIIRPPAGLLFP